MAIDVIEYSLYLYTSRRQKSNCLLLIHYYGDHAIYESTGQTESRTIKKTFCKREKVVNFSQNSHFHLLIKLNEKKYTKFVPYKGNVQMAKKTSFAHQYNIYGNNFGICFDLIS